jgi:hypothetical protein
MAGGCAVGSWAGAWSRHGGALPLAAVLQGKPALCWASLTLRHALGLLRGQPARLGASLAPTRIGTRTDVGPEQHGRRSCHSKAASPGRRTLTNSAAPVGDGLGVVGHSGKTRRRAEPAAGREESGSCEHSQQWCNGAAEAGAVHRGANGCKLFSKFT